MMNKEERRRLLDLIPEATDITRSKENIQPSSRGRSVATLTHLFTQDPSERESTLESTHTRFQQQLETLDEQDDPLQIYIDYMDWIMEAVPETNTLLTKLLEDATDQFKDDVRYQYDPRYLKIWIEYTKHVQEPREIFTFLMHQGIGQSLALFYEAYADYEETCQKFDEAAEIYALGIQKNAMPLKRLLKNYGLFQSRIQQKTIHKRQPEAKRQMDTLRATGQRTLLGHKFDSQSRVSVPANVYAGIQANQGTLTRPRPFGNASTSIETDTFAVYTDSSPTQGTTYAPLFITPSSSSRIENKQTVDTFAGSTLLQQTSPIQSERFEIYQDPPSSRRRSVDHNTRKRPRHDKKKEAQFIHNKDKYMKSSNSRGDVEYIMHFQFGDKSAQEMRAMQHGYHDGKCLS
ncbi:Mad3/BUB1 homology region 1-domain-containing protein [Gilbertella persicaria]|uniref:Mad3/BUB1 homology region 1-domain-containing protein n=1 Tax=Gilbertella persicaria TaxID=101096 RepID=UPI00221FFB94|nr:Mad3/BUB1 homology region 1-domain-containing protein [Gilbertella persicaria]KAI8094887.1 Mad3/BUB1 homology region 1-domain-containing protein [Gilbertella persicaria]